jgi:hypothetical protein
MSDKDFYTREGYANELQKMREFAAPFGLILHLRKVSEEIFEIQIFNGDIAYNYPLINAESLEHAGLYILGYMTGMADAERRIEARLNKAIKKYVEDRGIS